MNGILQIVLNIGHMVACSAFSIRTAGTMFQVHICVTISIDKSHKVQLGILAEADRFSQLVPLLYWKYTGKGCSCLIEIIFCDVHLYI